ncbi:MAG: hypothetical protein JO218_19750 [Burkholderiales bacterium]|nr:hypothetical protein [Burkholderiales bacterium]
MTKQLFLVIALTFGLTGCDRLTKLANQAELNARAIGAACRLSGRSLEDCFQRNERVSKADIYAGWREMNEYMAKNRLDAIAPPADKTPVKKAVGSVEISGGDDTAAATDKPAADATKPAEPAADAAKPADTAKPAN